MENNDGGSKQGQSRPDRTVKADPRWDHSGFADWAWGREKCAPFVSVKFLRELGASSGGQVVANKAEFQYNPPNTVCAATGKAALRRA